MTDPNGNPGCLRDRVERLPMRPRYIRVRARSAYEGSGTVGVSLAGPGPACFLLGEEVIAISCYFEALFAALYRSRSHRPGTPALGNGSVQSGRERGEGGRGAVPAQLVHIVKERDFGSQSGQRAKEQCPIPLAGE